MAFTDRTAIVCSRGESHTHQTVQMKVLEALPAAAVFLVTSALNTSSASAKPFIYADSYSYNGTYKECLKKAEILLKKHDFRDLYVENEIDRRSSITGYHKSEHITVEIECNQKLGVTVLGVAGLDNEFTFKTYQKLGNSDW